MKRYFLLILLGLFALPAIAAEYNSPRALNIGDTYVLRADGFTGDEDTTEPKTDANDGKNGDNIYYQRTNVARAHLDYWYTSNYQNPGEPNPNGPQWVEYLPPLNILGPGRYKITAEYRYSTSRATYAVPYIVTLGDGSTSTTWRVQSDQGTTYVTFILGEYDLGSTGKVRVEDKKQDNSWGSGSITFNKMKFTYLGPSDTQPPSVPTNVQATSSASTIMQVTWTASTDNIGVASYKIFRNGTQVGTSTTTSYLDTGLSASTTYSYTVSAVDTMGNNSAQSSPPAVGTTLAADSTPPSVPSNVQIGNVTGDSIQISWTASTDNRGVTGYKIFRNGSQVGTSATTTFVDSGLTASTTYSYRVSAYDGDGNNSAQSSPPAVATTTGAITITDLVPTNYVVTTFDVGSLEFIDRDFTITSMPERHKGRLGIRTANGDKDKPNLDFHFTVNQPVEVYVCMQDPIQPTTPLLSGFVSTGETLIMSDIGVTTYNIFKKTYPAGQISLGPKPGAGDGRSMFFVLFGYPEVPDNQPPSVPSNVTATAQSPTSIKVSWSASTDNVGVAGYKIFRNGTQVGVSATTSFTNTGLQPETTYSYTVLAHDAVGNESAQSSPPAVATTQPDTVPPSITQQPQAQDVCAGATATFTVAASGSGTLSYKWQKNGSDISNGGHYSGATTSTLTVSNVDSQDEANYRCVVTSPYGSATSNNAALTLVDCSSAVSVSADGHWLEFQGKRVMLVGDSVTQGWMECGTNFNQTAYVDALASRGINILMLWSYIGITDQNSDPRIGYNAPEIWPWTRSGNTFNLNQFNEAYFNRLRSLIEYCNSKGIVVLITIHDGWTKTRFAGHPFNSALGGSLTDKAQYVELHDYNNEMPTTYNAGWNRQQKHQYWLERFCDKLIQKTADQPNVIYEMFNEGEWYNQANLANFQKHFLRFWKARTDRLTMVNADHISGTNFRTESNCNIISYHNPNWNSGSTALTFFNHFAGAYNGTPVKPFFFSEPVPEYQGDTSLYDAITRMMWGTVIGGAGFVMQNDTSWGFDPNTIMAGKATARNVVLDREGHCSRFFNDSQVDLDSMRPQGSLSSTGVCMANTGKEYVVYSQASSFTVNLSGTSGTLTCRFYNPRTGVFEPVFNRTGGGTQSFTTPGSNDWVLHIKGAVDTQAPSVPTNVQAVAQSETSVQVTWTASTDNVGVTGYKIYRNGSQVGTSGTASFTDNGLQPKVTYSYTVSAYDAAGNNSAQSTPAAVVTTPDNTAPSVPTNVQAVAQSETSVQVTWSASTDNVAVAGYRVFRNGTSVGTSATTSFTDNGLQAGTEYSYTVLAYDSVPNDSAQSSPPAVVTTLDTTVPSVPTGVQAAAKSPTSVLITWNASTDNVGVVGYKVYRNGTLVGSPSGTNFTDEDLEPSTSYSYTVSAKDAAENESAQSSVAVAVTADGHSIADAKLLEDDDEVFLISKIVSAIFDDCIYVKELTEVTGIKVVAAQIPLGLAVGKTVNVTGIMKTSLPEYERYVSGTITMK